MDRRKNPYTPNAGAPPPALAGREEQIENFDILLDRLLKGYTDQSLLISGLRGVGKTVLLGEFVRVAESKGWTTVETEFAKEEQDSGYEEEELGGRCAAILGNGRRCPNAALPGSRYCGLDAHQALEGKPTDRVGHA